MKLLYGTRSILSLLGLVWAISGLWVMTHLAAQPVPVQEEDDLVLKLRVMNRILRIVETDYVTDPDLGGMIDAAIVGMLETLDPHTSYLDQEAYEEFQTETRGEFGGLGISIDRKGDYITVVTPIEGTPADRIGIRAGDRIIAVDSVSIVGVPTEEAIRLMRGPEGTPVSFTVERPGIDTPLEFSIVRETIHINSVPYAFRLEEEGVGYIRIRNFNRSTAEDLSEALDRLEDEGICGLLLDLRGNPGGSLPEVVDCVNEFLGVDRLVVSTRGRTPEAEMEYRTRFNRIRPDYPVIVLIDRASASAAEIFAGSMQDYDRALVMGETSFGKGSVQKLVPLDQGALKITISKYYIKSGRCIHKDYNDRMLRGEDVSAEEREAFRKKNHAHVYYTEKGRVVYGGGGITPDIEVKPQKLTELAVRLLQEDIFFNYAVQYKTDHPEPVAEDFTPDDAMIDGCLAMAGDTGIDYDRSQAEQIRQWMRGYLGRRIVEVYHGSAAGQKNYLRYDAQSRAALEIFEQCETIDEMFQVAQETAEIPEHTGE